MNPKHEIRLDVSKLENLEAMLAEANGSYLKVGILGNYAGRVPGASGVERENSEMTNPQLGLIHEFGAFKAKIPERSFLRMPIGTQLGTALEEMGDSAAWAAFVAADGIVALLDLVGNKCIELIAFAFHTAGFGNWAPLKRRTIQRKKNSDILIDSGQLQRSITYAVVRPGAPQVSISPMVPQ